MKNSIIIVLFFAIGVIIGYWQWIPNFYLKYDYTSYALYLLMFLVGIGIGADNTALQSLKKLNLKIILVPLAVVIGSISGGLILFVFMNKGEIADFMAVSAGFGYYSLSSIFITQYSGEYFGTIALLSNIIRELLTLLFVPLMVKYFGKLSSVASGGATTMDTTLPVISKFAGKDIAIIAVISGIVLTISVPFIITFIYAVF